MDPVRVGGCPEGVASRRASRDNPERLHGDFLASDVAGEACGKVSPCCGEVAPCDRDVRGLTRPGTSSRLTVTYRGWPVCRLAELPTWSRLRQGSRDSGKPSQLTTCGSACEPETSHSPLNGWTVDHGWLAVGSNPGTSSLGTRSQGMRRGYWVFGGPPKCGPPYMSNSLCPGRSAHWPKVIMERCPMPRGSSLTSGHFPSAA